MGIQLKNRTFLKMFAIFFLCLLLVAYLLFAYFFTREQEAVRAKNQGEIESSIEHAVDYLEELVQREGRLSAQLRAYPWVVQMASGSEVFAGRFTPRRLQEISQDFLFNTLLNTEVLYRAVYFTKNNRVMHGGGMNGGEYFFKSQGVPEEQLEGFMQMITGTVKARRVLYGSGGGVCFRGNVLLINPVQNSSRPGAYLCTMLNTSVVAEQIKLMLPAGLTGFRVYDGENQALVLEDRPGDGGDRVLGGYYTGAWMGAGVLYGRRVRPRPERLLLLGAAAHAHNGCAGVPCGLFPGGVPLSAAGEALFKAPRGAGLQGHIF